MCSNDPACERRSLLATLTGGPTLTLILTQLVATILALGIAYAVVCRVLGIARYPHVYTPFALATVFCGIVIGLTIAFGYRTFRKAAMHLIEPLTDMAATAARLTRTRETTRFATNGGILEIDQIAETLNALYTAQEHQIDELTDLVRALMHDIRTPLNHITGAAEEIGQQKGDAQDAAARIAESCRVISRLIDDHTEITLNNSRSDRTPAEPVDFTAILADGCELYQSLADVRNQKIALHLPESPLILRAHKSKLQRLLGNLLDNAIKYSPNAATIDVSIERYQGSGMRDEKDGRVGCPQPTAGDTTSQKADCAVGSRSETGVGTSLFAKFACAEGTCVLKVSSQSQPISPADLPHIFDATYRGANTRHIPGHGLGLAMVKSIVSFYHGTITVTSTPTLTTFTITLPIA